MMICKKCGSKYHYCGSCDYDEIASEGYCSEECWASGDEYKEQYVNFKNFYKTLDNDQKTKFKNWFDNTYEFYDYYIEKWKGEIDES